MAWLTTFTSCSGCIQHNRYRNVCRPSKDNLRSGLIESVSFAGNLNGKKEYGAFSCDVNRRDAVFRYIEDQKVHHNRESFVDEYRAILTEFQVQYNEAFIFRIPD